MHQGSGSLRYFIRLRDTLPVSFSVGLAVGSVGCCLAGSVGRYLRRQKQDKMVQDKMVEVVQKIDKNIKGWISR